MKKALMLIVAATMLAAPVFAEITISGEFEALWEHEFTETEATDSYDDDDENSAELDLGIAIGDFTTLSANILAEMNDGAEKVLSLDSWELTQDITGALGADGPITFELSVGDLSFEPKQYVTDYHEFGEFDCEGGDIDFIASVGLMDMVTIDLGIFPSTYKSDNFDFGVTAYGVFGPASIGVSFTREYTTPVTAVAAQDAFTETWTQGAVTYTHTFDAIEEVDAVTGGVATDMELNALLDFAPLEVAAQLQVMNLEDDTDEDMQVMLAATFTSEFGLEATLEYFLTEMFTDLDMDLRIAADFTTGPVTFDVNFDVYQLMESNKVITTDDKDTPADTSDDVNYDVDARLLALGAGVSFAATDVIELHVNFDINNLTEASDSIEFNVGSDLTIGAMSYSVDYTLATGNDGTYDDNFYGDTDHTISVLAKVSF